MKNRYKKISLMADNGITFEVSEETKGNLIIRALIDKANDCSKNYANPPIPEGYKHIMGEWNNGFVIERYSDGSQFVWIPVGSLDSNGTLDGVSFNQKLGRRNFQNNEFSESEFHETLEGELSLQLESVNKYGGFYISRYNISKNKENGKPQSVKGEEPWTNINFKSALEVAAMLETNNTITSHLPFGAEYDSVLEWFIESGVKTCREITTDSTDWGNYWSQKDSPGKIVETGSREEWCANNIYDLAGNVDEWTQEQNYKSFRVVRGGYFAHVAGNYPVSHRALHHIITYYNSTGFRATLYIK